MNVLRIHSTSDPLFVDYRNFSEKHPLAGYFQTPAFFALAQAWPEASPVLLVCTNGSELTGSLLGIVLYERKGPFHLLTSRTVVYGGPLLAGSIEQQRISLSLLLQALQREVSGISLFTQFRNFFEWGDLQAVFVKHGYHRNERLNLLIDTSAEDKAWRAMSNNRRRQVMASIKNGAEIIESPTAEEVSQFYSILRNLYRQRVRKPLPSREFFMAFHRLVTDGHPGFMVLIRFQGKIVGGIMSPLMPGRAVYEWYVCGLDREHKIAGIYPSVLATWWAIRKAAQLGIPYFDFMGMGHPGKPYGVRDFKVRFGGTWVNYGRMVRINNQFLYSVAEFGYNILRLLKKL